MFFSTDDAQFLAQVKDVLPLSSAIDREKLWPLLQQVEREYIIPLLEDDLYQDLDKFYNHRDQWTSGSGDDATYTEALLNLIRIAQLNLAYFIGFDLLNSISSAAGFQRVGDTQGFKGLYKYQEENLRKYFEKTGFNYLDSILKYLEQNLEHFPDWEESSNYTLRRTAIIKDAETFDAICFINRSRLTFLRLQRFINEVIDFEIKPLLGTEWTSLQESLASENPEEKYTLLAVEIRKPLAFLSCAKLIEKTGDLNDRGLFFEGKNSLFPDDTYRKPAEGDAQVVAMTAYNKTGYQYIEALRQYLLNNGFTSGSVDGNVYDRDNTGKKTFVA